MQNPFEIGSVGLSIPDRPEQRSHPRLTFERALQQELRGEAAARLRNIGASAAFSLLLVAGTSAALLNNRADIAAATGPSSAVTMAMTLLGVRRNKQVRLNQKRLATFLAEHDKRGVAIGTKQVDALEMFSSGQKMAVATARMNAADQRVYLQFSSATMLASSSATILLASVPLVVAAPLAILGAASSAKLFRDMYRTPTVPTPDLGEAILSNFQQAEAEKAKTATNALLARFSSAKPQ
jgi:hypothetical protein